MAVKPISRERFKALCRSRQPVADMVSAELEWYADEAESVLGLVLADLQDRDWVWIVLGRDEIGLFRAIDVGTSIPTREGARELLKGKLKEALSDRAQSLPSGRGDTQNGKPVRTRDRQGSAESEFHHSG